MRADKRTRCRILYLIERTNRNILISLNTLLCTISYLGGGIYKGPINKRSFQLGTDSNFTVDEAHRIVYFFSLGVLAFLSLTTSNFLKIRNQIEP